MSRENLDICILALSKRLEIQQAVVAGRFSEAYRKLAEYYNSGLQLQMPLIISISGRGLEFIAKHEGFSSKVYNDVGGKHTIGYGHLIKPGESFETVTKQEALDLLHTDVATAEKALKRNIEVVLRQHQYDALVSFTYNLGGKALSESIIKDHINSGQFDQAANDFIMYKSMENQYQYLV